MVHLATKQKDYLVYNLNEGLKENQARSIITEAKKRNQDIGLSIVNIVIIQGNEGMPDDKLIKLFEENNNIMDVLILKYPEMDRIRKEITSDEEYFFELFFKEISSVKILDSIIKLFRQFPVGLECE